MEPSVELPEPAGIAWRPTEQAILWETATESPVAASLPTGDPATKAAPPVQAAVFDSGTRTVAPLAARYVRRCAAALTNPTFLQLHGRSPMETTRIATTTVADAAEVLGRQAEVHWGRGRSSGQLLLGAFRESGKELGRPHVADGMLHAHGGRRLRVTVAIYRYGSERCGIQIRPRYRRPRTARRLRHCLSSTHGAADRLRDLVLTVDFMPPVALVGGGSPLTSNAS